jgi:hypothetical protein
VGQKRRNGSGPRSTVTNATYGNGVLVLAMPKQAQSVDAEFQLEVIEASRGECVGHTGQEIRSTTIQEHR